MAYFVFFLIDIYRGRKEKPRSENGLRIFSLIVKNQTIPFSLLQYLEEGEGNDLVPRGISLDSSFFKKSSPLKKRASLLYYHHFLLTPPSDFPKEERIPWIPTIPCSLFPTAQVLTFPYSRFPSP